MPIWTEEKKERITNAAKPQKGKINMCTPASFVVTKKNKDLRAFWHEDVSDSHEDIIEYFNLKEQNVRGEITLVRVEVVPPDSDYTLPVSKWEFMLDQDILPDWYDAEATEKACRKELAAWKRAKIILPSKKLAVLDGKRCVVRVYSTIKKIHGEAKIDHVCGKAKIGHVYGEAKIDYVSDKAKIGHVYGKAEIGSVYDEAKIGSVYGKAKIGSVSGEAKIGHVYGEAKIGTIFGKAKIGSVYDEAKIGSVYGKAKIGSVSGEAKIGTIFGKAKIGHVFGKAKIDYVCGKAKIGTIFGKAKIDYVYDEAKIGHVYGKAKIIKDNR